MIIASSFIVCNQSTDIKSKLLSLYLIYHNYFDFVPSDNRNMIIVSRYIIDREFI